MKLLLLMLAGYFLALSAIPCRDGESVLAVSSIEHVNDRTEKSHQDTDHHSDGCSPLCSCQCCSLSMVATKKFDSGIGREVVLELSSTILDFSSPSGNNYPNQVWQPPKYNA